MFVDVGVGNYVYEYIYAHIVTIYIFVLPKNS